MRPICEICPVIPLDCLRIIHKKINGLELHKKELFTMINAIYCDRLSDIHIASFLTACAANTLLETETIHLTRAMVDVGDRLHWKRKIVVDKHCIGGLAGNRTTPILVAIVASAGLLIPKTSSQSITSPSGTADTMSVLTNVALSSEKICTVVAQTGGCFVWGGHANISPVDDILIQVERQLALDYDSQLIASILSKKIAIGATHVLIDIPVGRDVKVKNRKHALFLKSHFEIVARAFGLQIHVMITDGSTPVGNGIGPAIEAADILRVLRNEPDAPKQLKEKACCMANAIFKMVHAKHDACQILESGQAWDKFQEICNAQGGPIRSIPVASFQRTLYAQQEKKITVIRNSDIVAIAKLAGAPLHPEAGVYLHAHVGNTVKKGEPLITIHARTEENMKHAMAYINQMPDAVWRPHV
ncbi:MAG: thymidine phosphorylase [Pseudomonadota bacterium]